MVLVGTRSIKLKCIVLSLNLFSMQLYFNHFLNKNTYIFIYKKLRGKAKDRNKFPNKWPPKPQKNLKINIINSN